jgi:hypothetical protein
LIVVNKSNHVLGIITRADLVSSSVPVGVGGSGTSQSQMKGKGPAKQRQQTDSCYNGSRYVDAEADDLPEVEMDNEFSV